MQRRAVEVWYLRGGSVAAKARYLCCSETTMRDRVCMAQRSLGQWLADKAAARQQDRARVERLSGAAVRIR